MRYLENLIWSFMLLSNSWPNHLETNLIDYLSLVARFTTTIPFMDNLLPRFSTSSHDSGLAVNSLSVNSLSNRPAQKMYDICVFSTMLWHVFNSVAIVRLVCALLFLYIVRHCGMTEGFMYCITSIMYNWHHDLYTCQNEISSISMRGLSLIYMPTMIYIKITSNSHVWSSESIQSWPYSEIILKFTEIKPLRKLL